MKSENKLMCSAIWYDDGNEYEHQPTNIPTGFVVCGFRHHNCISTLAITMGIGNYDKTKITQGFLTNGNRFVSRFVAKSIALNNGQVDPSHSGILYSEDLW